MENSLNKTSLEFLKFFIVINKIFKFIEKKIIKKNYKKIKKIKKINSLLNNYNRVFDNLHYTRIHNYFLKWKFIISYSDIFFIQKYILFFNNIKNQVIILSKLTNLHFKTNNNKNISGFIKNSRKKLYHSFLIYKDDYNKKQVAKEFMKLINLLIKI